MIDSFNILDVRVAATNLSLAADFIGKKVSVGSQAKTYICIAPVSTIVDCRRDPAYLQVINGAGMVTPDGMPLVWLGRLKGHKDIGRTYGPDLLPYVCDAGQDKGWRHFFYGGTPEVLEKLVTRLREQFPRLQVAGCHAPAMQSIGQVESVETLEVINRSRADILWVGLGSPKQDFWMANHRALLDVPVMVGVGAAFDFLSGTKSQAPRWMQRSGLEWFFRLGCEPRRLWKRYLVGNALFVYWLIRDAVGKVMKR